MDNVLLKQILQEYNIKREKAIFEANRKKQELLNINPKLSSIESEISKISISITKAILNSDKIEKNNFDTLVGLGDIRYLHGDYKNAVKIYKKAYKKDKKNYETIIKLSTAQRQYAQKPKEIEYNKLCRKSRQNLFLILLIFLWKFLPLQ